MIRYYLILCVWYYQYNLNLNGWDLGQSYYWDETQKFG
ncbi:hypothetical protein RINTHM_6650 [Richelia intracellularis HM01]|nr:hypothetical protein RINTHM_6650 [Richelia intracellularis HM01]